MRGRVEQASEPGSDRGYAGVAVAARNGHAGLQGQIRRAVGVELGRVVREEVAAPPGSASRRRHFPGVADTGRTPAGAGTGSLPARAGRGRNEGLRESAIHRAASLRPLRLGHGGERSAGTRDTGPFRLVRASDSTVPGKGRIHERAHGPGLGWPPVRRPARHAREAAGHSPLRQGSARRSESTLATVTASPVTATIRAGRPPAGSPLLVRPRVACPA